MDHTRETTNDLGDNVHNSSTLLWDKGKFGTCNCHIPSTKQIVANYSIESFGAQVFCVDRKLT